MKITTPVLDGKVAVITRGSSGIGLATVRLCTGTVVHAARFG